MKSSVAQSTILAVIVGMGVLNFAVRFIPIAVVSRIELPRPVARWLSFVPIAVMGALVASEVIVPDGRWSNPLTSPAVWAAALTALVFRFTKSFLGATVAGMAAFVALSWALPALLH